MTPRHHRPPRSRRIAAWAVPPVLALGTVACSDDDPATSDTIDGLGDTGGQVVDDTTIMHAAGSDSVSIGGLPVELPKAGRLAEAPANILTPASWPTLDVLALQDPDFRDDSPEYGIVTFAQTDLVTDDASRVGLIDDAFAATTDPEIPTAHTSTTADADTGATCWLEIRLGDKGNVRVGTAVLLMAGPGAASSGIVTKVFGDGDALLPLLGDIVASACGSRPDGL